MSVGSMETIMNQKPVLTPVEKTAEEFKKKFRALLDEYDAVITADDYYKGYAECGSDIRMVVDIPGWGGYGFDDPQACPEDVEIDLGAYFDKDS